MEQGPPDAILGLVEVFNKDSNPNKVSLVVGAYRDDDGKPYVLRVVRKVSCSSAPHSLTVACSHWRTMIQQITTLHSHRWNAPWWRRV